MPDFINNGVRIYYETAGSGPPLLMVAGLASDSQSWQPAVNELAEHFTLIMPDNRGVGRSSQDCPVSIDLMADDCTALIRHLGFDRVNLLGHSMGGMVAMNFAARYPQLLEKLALAATVSINTPRNNLMFRDWVTALESGTDPAEWFRRIFFWIFTERFFDNRQNVDVAISYLLSYPWPQSAQAFRQQTEAISSHDARNGLGFITAPTCVIAGDEDILFPFQNSISLAEQIHGASLKVIKGAAHSIHTEKPDEFIRALLDFFFN